MLGLVCLFDPHGLVDWAQELSFLTDIIGTQDIRSGLWALSPYNILCMQLSFGTVLPFILYILLIGIPSSKQSRKLYSEQISWCQR